MADVALRLQPLGEEEALLLVAPLDVLEIVLQLEEEDLEERVDFLLLFLVLAVLELARLGRRLADRRELLLDVRFGLALLDVVADAP